jgi:CMP-N-acetylneuraminic acid synthetase
MYKFIALVPMKAHSVRVKNKNIRNMAGIPLYHYILRTLEKCKSISEIYVDTDSEIIKKGILKNFKNVKIIDRPEHLRGDDISMNQIIEYDLSRIEGEYFLQTHCTNPLIKTETIERAIEFFIAHPEYDSLFAVKRMQKRYYDSKGNPINHDVRKLINTQDLDPLYEEASAVYLFTRKSFEKFKNRIGERPYMFEINPEEAIDIDEEFDFKLVELIISSRKLGKF